jgi:t-SNARE complex subunit (syntaxin)
MLAETKNELDDFHQSSKELEEELERELQRTEKTQQELRVKVERAENERDSWKVRQNFLLFIRHSHRSHPVKIHVTSN